MSAAFAVCAVLAGNVAAQSEKVSITLIPQPNQTTRSTVTTEWDADFTSDGEPSDPPGTVQTAKMILKSTLAIVRKNGPLDNQGRLETEITYERVNFEMSMNGNPIPAEETVKKLSGKKIKIIFDRKGELLDFKVPDDFGAETTAFKQSLQLIYGNLPKGELSVGETITAPLETMVPLIVGWVETGKASPDRAAGKLRHSAARISPDLPHARELAAEDVVGQAVELATQIAALPRGAVLETKRRTLLERRHLWGFLFREERRVFERALGIEGSPRTTSEAEPAPPTIADLRRSGVPIETIDSAVRAGELVRVGPDLVMTPTMVSRALEAVRAAGDRGITVSQVRQLLGTTRRYAVPLMEHLDRTGRTRRSGDLRFARGT